MPALRMIFRRPLKPKENIHPFHSLASRYWEPGIVLAELRKQELSYSWGVTAPRIAIVAQREGEAVLEPNTWLLILCFALRILNKVKLHASNGHQVRSEWLVIHLKSKIQKVWALTSVAQWAGHHPAKGNVASSSPGQGTYLSCGFGPQLGCVRGATDGCFSLTSMFLPLSFFLSSPNSKNKLIKSFFKKDTKWSAVKFTAPGWIGSPQN